MMTPSDKQFLFERALSHCEIARHCLAQARQAERDGDFDNAAALHLDCDWHMSMRDELIAAARQPVALAAAAG